MLGTAVYTEFIWTVNAWSLMNWLEKRLDPGAQWEHRAVRRGGAGRMFEQVMPITAEAFKQLGAAPMRPSWDEYFVEIARQVATRSTCLRRRWAR